MHIYILLFLALFIILFVILKKKTREGIGTNNDLYDSCNKGNIEDCKKVATNQGLTLGGGSHGFELHGDVKGLFSPNKDIEGIKKGEAYFGMGGTPTENIEEYSYLPIYRPTKVGLEKIIPPMSTTNKKEENVEWDPNQKKNVNTNSTRVSSTTSSGWDSYAMSTQKINRNDDEWQGVKYKLYKNASYVMLGLGSGKDWRLRNKYQNIDYSLYCSRGSPHVYERNQYRKNSNKQYNANNTMEVRVKGDEVQYLVDDIVFYTSTTKPLYPLYVKIAPYHSAYGGAKDVKIYRQIHDPPLNMCGSDCMNDEDNCSGNLKCFQYTTTSVFPRGCIQGEASNQQFIKNRGYCYDEAAEQKEKKKEKEITTQLDNAKTEIGRVLADDNFTGSMKKVFFGFKHSLIEGNDTVFLTGDQVTTKLGMIDAALDAADVASAKTDVEMGHTFAATQENNTNWNLARFNLYKLVYDSIIQPNLPDFNFLASIIGINIDNEVTLMGYVTRIEEGYGKYKARIDWEESINKLKAYIFALKIIKWQISDNYIKYFKQANEAINNGNDVVLDSISLTYATDIKNGSDDSTPDINFDVSFNSILGEVRLKVQDKMMKKLNDLLKIPENDTPADNLRAYVGNKINTFTGNRIAECNALCLENQKNNLNCKGCGEISPFQNEINFILHPPLTPTNMDKLIKEYIFIYNKSKNDTSIRYYTKNTIVGTTDATVLTAPSGAYIKCNPDINSECDFLKKDGKISIYWKGGTGPPDYDTEISGKYYRPKYPLWGFTGNIQPPTFTPTTVSATTVSTTQGFTNMGDLMKSTGLVQTFNNIKQNRFNDVFSFFKNNAFKTGIIEGNDDNTDKLIDDDTGAKLHLVGDDTFALTGGIKKILVKKDRLNVPKWYKYVFNAKEGTSDRNDNLSLDKILNKIEDNKANIYSTVVISDGIGVSGAKPTPSTGTLLNMKKDIFKIPIADWDKAIINLYVNDDGDSFITTETQQSCENNICQNGEPHPNGEDEAGLIKDVMISLDSIEAKSELKPYMYFIHNSPIPTTVSQFVKNTTDPNTIDCNGCIYKMIGNGRSLLITRKGMFRVEYTTMECPLTDTNGFLAGTKIGNRQQCGGVKYDTNCRLNYVESNSAVEEIPRCYKADGITLNPELTPYLKKCADIPGMVAEDPNDLHKCITNVNHAVGGKKLSENELRSCYLYDKSDETSRMECDPGKEKNEDGCLCKFENTDTNGVTLVGKPIVEDSVCEVLGDTDLTYDECAEYASWTNGQIENKFFNIDSVGVGYRRGCQEMLDGDENGVAKNKFYYVAPNKRYGTQTEVRKWGNDELDTLGNLQNRLGGNRNICKTTYLNKKLFQEATEIDDGETEIVNNITIPGIRDDKTSSGNYLITNVTKTERDYAKLNCDAKNSWDACYMEGNQTSLNEGERLVEDAGYSEFKLYPEEADTTEADTTEGFMGFRKTIREGATGSQAQIYGSGGCLKNCAPRRFTNGNCDEDIKTTKTVDGIQRFFKMCPQECLGPTPQGAESNGYEDIDKGGTVGPDGATITYDAAIHGCRTSKQCEETCNKSSIQMKHVYENGCNDDDECTHSKLRNQYEVERNGDVDGQIQLDSTIKITQVSMTDDLIRKYNKEGGMVQKSDDDVQQNDNGLINEGNDSRDRAIFKFIEELKKKSVSQIIGFSYEPKTVANSNPGNNLRIIYKKANVFAKINITPDTNWKTYIHKRKWEDYWYDPNRPKIAALERNLTEREMQRMQGIDLGISMDAFDKIPLYWQNSKTKEANFDDICEWVNDKIKAGELKPKDKCSDSFKSSWASRTLGIDKSPSKGINFEEFEQVFNLRQTAVQGSSYTDMTNNMDIGQTDLSLDDYYKRNLLKSKVENRLGGSDNAYTKTYKPLNPDARPKFFNSAWGLFH